MPDYSATARRTINAVSAPESPVWLLEIDHPDLATPSRVVSYSEDITHQGNVFTALGYEFIPPGDYSQGLPRAALSVDNVGRVLTDWIDSSKGGRGATARFIQVLPSDPDTIEWDLTMNLDNIEMDALRVRGELTFDDLLNLPAVAVTYRPEVAPGLY